MTGALARLPIQVSPHHGETTDSYIRRLARANHLKPSYLHGFLCGPPLWFGKPLLDRLAAVAGRSPAALERALADTRTPRRRRKHAPTRHYMPYDKTKLFRTIRIDAETEGLSIRSLAERYQVHRRTVRAALNCDVPPPRKATERTSPVLDPIRALIDPMLDTGITVREIWKRLLDEHNASISYSTLHGYVRAQQTQKNASP